ncbi:MAG: ABC-F family ATP-binding cassette domain-containing protein, partial [Bacillales bacterium]
RLKRYEKQQEEIAKLEEFIQRNIARAATAKLARSRRKQLQRMERISKPAGQEKTVSFGFKIDRQSGNDVLMVEDLSVGYGDKPVCRNISFKVTRGESVAIVGPNGIGKSTLLKTIVKKLPPLGGTIRFGTNVTVAYYDQELTDLYAGKDVLHELWDDHPMEKEQTIRSILGSFLFSGDDVLKPVRSLSGGEKARLALAKLMMKNANLLVLDEPTNHLDLESKEVLESALIDYPGTILFVSHDRYFMNRIATKVLELDSTGVTEYLGDYDYYVEKKLEQEELAKFKAAQEKKEQAGQESRSSYEKQKEARRLERQRQRRLQEIEYLITMLEEQIEKNNLLLCEPDVYQDHEKVRQIQEENEEARSKLDALLEEWAELAE